MSNSLCEYCLQSTCSGSNVPKVLNPVFEWYGCPFTRALVSSAITLPFSSVYVVESKITVSNFSFFGSSTGFGVGTSGVGTAFLSSAAGSGLLSGALASFGFAGSSGFSTK